MPSPGRASGCPINHHTLRQVIPDLPLQASHEPRSGCQQHCRENAHVVHEVDVKLFKVPICNDSWQQTSKRMCTVARRLPRPN